MHASLPRKDVDAQQGPSVTRPGSGGQSWSANELQASAASAGPTLSIDGTCRLCRASGAIACRLAPHISVLEDRGSTAQGSGVVLNVAGRELVGIDAVIAWLHLVGGVGERASSLLANRLVHSVASRCYRWVARHRHFLG